MQIKISDIKTWDTIQVRQYNGLFKVLNVTTNAIQVVGDSGETSWLYITDIDIERHYPAVPNQEATNESQQQKQHKHKDLIIAWANGAEVQYMDNFGEWFDVKAPYWYKDSTYRIKPVKPKNNIKRMYVEHKSCLDNAWNKPNLELEFDSESGELVKANVLE